MDEFEDVPMENQESLTENDEEKEREGIRFSMELEFVQSLGNPHYIKYLSETGVLQDSQFVAYLKYLLYWTDPLYSKYIIYPHSTSFLLYLQDASFRNHCANLDFILFLHHQQFYHWKFHRNNRSLYPNPSSSSNSTPIPSSSTS